MIYLGRVDRVNGAVLLDSWDAEGGALRGKWAELGRTFVSRIPTAS